MRIRDDALRVEEILDAEAVAASGRRPTGLLNENSFGSSVGTL